MTPMVWNPTCFFFIRQGRFRGLIALVFMAIAVFFPGRGGWGAPPVPGPAAAQEAAAFKLKTALLCEGVSDSTPQNPSVVFSVSRGRVYCFSTFGDIFGEQVIYHYWYSRDHLAAKIKLALHPPGWSTFSNIQLRQSDKGPWRVEIVDEKEKILKTLRFSVIE